jgi:hypothetical protein
MVQRISSNGGIEIIEGWNCDYRPLVPAKGIHPSRTFH